MKEEELRKQAWDFFQLQAGQRLTTFNFYVVIASILCTGLAATFREDDRSPGLGITFGLLLVLFSLAFWKLDQRNRTLIRSAENALKYFEGTSPFGNDVGGMPHVVKRFLREEAESAAMGRSRSCFPWRNSYGYSECFRFLFATFAAVGLAGCAWSLYRLVDP